ncbi:MAG: outer membrane beta-barrel protein [Cyclobacteriaceae bacterium]
MKYILTIAFVLLGEIAFAQFWFGGKVGAHRTSFNYQNPETVFLIGGRELVQNELYNPVNANYNYEFGATVTYTATTKYQVHTEILFERINKTVRSRENAYLIDNSFRYSYISVPLLLRVTTQGEPVHYYFNLGPKLSYLARATGTLFIDDFVENSILPRDVRLVYNAEDGGNTESVVLERPNRLQYSLVLGGGALLDLKTGGRLMIDFRYSWGHSNLGSNTDSRLLDFAENVEFNNQMISFSVGYVIPYNPAELLKGSSTNKIQNTGKKKKIKSKNRK